MAPAFTFKEVINSAFHGIFVELILHNRERYTVKMSCLFGRAADSSFYFSKKIFSAFSVLLSLLFQQNILFFFSKNFLLSCSPSTCTENKEAPSNSKENLSS